MTLQFGPARQSWPDADVTNLVPYDEIYLPAVFHPWGCLLVEALGPAPGAGALDLGCGPGTVARILSARLGPSGAVLGLDASPGMLRLASAKPAVPAGAPITYMEGGLAPLPLPDGSIDAVTGQQVIQFAPDPAAALAEARRVLRPGGLVGLTIWSGTADNPLFRALHGAIASFFGPEAAGRLAKPWSMPPDRLVDLLIGAGFTDVVQAPRTIPVCFPGGLADACTMLLFSPVSDEVAALDEPSRRVLHQLVGRLLEPPAADGAVHTTTTASLIAARR
ncbi:methyltransferase domain-containing protein [Catenulispora rubra]|uniref:methyltransferase domain-containing protein n=1 Tax=Catenulispora rubra TaxID=280293 RepID=UPI00189243D6|nr:methyltransferase domain-containing protein [Catenulispora rubra]